MLRRATPDSEAVASSEDDVPWPHSTFGSLPRKENGVPGLGGGIWAQSSRGSFKLDDARRIAARQAVLSNAGNIHAGRLTDTPSPTASEAKSLPFSIPLRPTGKTVRSLSHSQGQRDIPAMLNAHAGATDRNTTLPPLGLVNEAEEVDTENGSDIGAVLTQTTSHPAGIGMYQRSAYSNHIDDMESAIHGSDSRGRVDTFDEAFLRDRLSSALGGMRLGQYNVFLGNNKPDRLLDGIPRNRTLWKTSDDWDGLHTGNERESRRHSLAGEVPTRRGSIAASHDMLHDERSALGFAHHRGFPSHDSHESFHIPDLYQVQRATLEPHERADMRDTVTVHPPNRPRKDLYIVSFKCARAGVFYLLDNTGLTVQEGDMVIVEADRGQDLGTVQHAKVSPEEARVFLQKYSEEQYKWLMMFSNNNQAGAVNPNATVYGDNSNNEYGRVKNMPSTRAPKDQFQNLKPKAIKRMAREQEVRMLKDKEGNEAKAKRCCQQKVTQHRLDMEILEAEFQWDWQKLIFYYYADHYVNFKELVNDLYKLYKVRLWMSAVNPASFSPNAINQPPSGIGPGAVSDSYPVLDVDHSYAMTYGNDPDPYGAIPPYQIGYNTYDANYPSIPGMPNSFAPVPTSAQPGLAQWPDATSSIGSPLTSPSGYSTNTGASNTPLASPLSAMTGRSSLGSAYMMPYASPFMPVGVRPAAMMQNPVTIGASANQDGQTSNNDNKNNTGAGQRGQETRHSRDPSYHFGAVTASREQQQQAMLQMAWANHNRSKMGYPMPTSAPAYKMQQHHHHNNNNHHQNNNNHNNNSSHNANAPGTPKRDGYGDSNQQNLPGGRPW